MRTQKYIICRSGSACTINGQRAILPSCSNIIVMVGEQVERLEFIKSSTSMGGRGGVGRRRGLALCA